MTMSQVTRLEEAWKSNPAVTTDDLDKPNEDDEPAHVALRYPESLPPCCVLIVRRRQ